MLMRRINREFKNDKYKLTDIYSGNPCCDKVVEFYCNNTNVKVIIPNDYPFRPPSKIYIDDDEINHSYFENHPPDVLLEFKKRKGNACPVCDTHMCGNNWSPSGITLRDVASQLITFVEQLKSSHIKIFIQTSNILPFGDELILYIARYI